MQGQTEDDVTHDIHHEPLLKVILDLLCFGNQWGLRRWILKMIDSDQTSLGKLTYISPGIQNCSQLK